ncbi:MAG: DUF11 domain-containing protein, partial [Actinomycetia bacterium]|nr:DUF11 domain-containing protein [Actinomycetes bacterium]
MPYAPETAYGANNRPRVLQHFGCAAGQSQLPAQADRCLALILAEGESTPAFRAPVNDRGLLDVHAATVEWGDGTPAPAEVLQANGFGTVLADGHVFEDDLDLGARLCVTDDSGDGTCESLPIRVVNLPPAVDAGAGGATFAGSAFQLTAATFTDPGAGDTHAATVDWGDGPIEPAAVIQGSGTGTIGAQHVFATAGTYTAEVCVTDNDGGAACDSLQVEVAVGPPVLTATKVDALVDDPGGDGVVNPGDAIEYVVTVTNSGQSPATGVVLDDAMPLHTALVAGSVTASQGTSESEDPIRVSLGEVPPGASTTVSFQVRLANPLPA